MAKDELKEKREEKAEGGDAYGEDDASQPGAEEGDLPGGDTPTPPADDAGQPEGGDAEPKGEEPEPKDDPEKAAGEPEEVTVLTISRANDGKGLKITWPPGFNYHDIRGILKNADSIVGVMITRAQVQAALNNLMSGVRPAMPGEMPGAGKIIKPH